MPNRPDSIDPGDPLQPAKTPALLHEFRILDKKDSRLWLVVLLVTGCLTVGFLLTTFEQGSRGGFQSPLVFGLPVLVTLLWIYVAQRRRENLQLRSRVLTGENQRTQLAARVGGMRQLIQAARTLDTSMGAESVAANCTESAQRLAEAHRTLTVLYGGQGQGMELAGSCGPLPAPAETSLPTFAQLQGHLRAQESDDGEPLLLEGEEMFEVVGPGPWTEGTNSLIMVPLRAGSALFGYVVVQQVATEPVFGEYQRNLLGLFGGFVSHALTVARAQSRLQSEHEKIRNSMSKLKQARGRLVELEKLRALSDLLKGVADDVSTPLGSLMGHAEALGELTSENDSELFEHVDAVRRDAHQCSDLLESLVSITAADDDSTEHLTNTIRDALQLKSYEIRRFGVEVQSDISDDLPMPAMKRGPLQLILVHLLTNAVASVKLRPTRRVAISATADEPGIRLVVRDTGRGIPLEFQGQGGGLGVTNLEELLAAHDGTIEMECEEGRGSTFVLRIPALTPSPTT